MNKGICCAGNMIVDAAYRVERWPGEGQLTHILEDATYSNGGLVCNVGTDLARLDPAMPVYAAGCVGRDEKGEFMLRELSKYPNLDLGMVRRVGVTAYTLVMNSFVNRERTFFTYPGGNALLTPETFDWDRLDCDILHAGYILLMPGLDEEDAEYGTVMARLLAMAKARGVRTSVDVVSEVGERTARLMPPALKYTDYCVINELEAQALTGVTLRDENGRLVRASLPEALRAIRKMGVGIWCVIHCPEESCGLDENDVFVECPSLLLPEGYIKGTTGAGDAFCAGVLYGAEKGMALCDALLAGTCTAAASLSRPDASSGIGTYEEVIRLKDILGSRCPE